MLSLWEKQSFTELDIAIVGAGITGLSAACTLKEQDPTLRIAVLERGLLPSGASTKNAGFACFGSVSELLDDVEKMGEDNMVRLVEQRYEGLEKTCTRLGRARIDLQVKGGYELCFDKGAPDQVSYINRLLSPIFQEQVFHPADPSLAQFGFYNVAHLIQNKLEGQLDTGKLISSLWDYCSSLGIKLFTGCEVKKVIETTEGVEILTPSVSFKAKKVGICTNAFAKRLVKPDVDIVPGRGMVLSIIPASPLSFSGTFHYHSGYNYFRDYHGKLLFGGGRQLALEQEKTEEFGINGKIRTQLIKDLETMILPNQPYKVEMQWSGIMAFGASKQPLVQRCSDHIAIGVRLGGMGVAIGSIVGERLAELLME